MELAGSSFLAPLKTGGRQCTGSIAQGQALSSQHCCSGRWAAEARTTTCITCKTRVAPAGAGTAQHRPRRIEADSVPPFFHLLPFANHPA